MNINASRFCPKSVTGIKIFQMRIKTKVKTNENQHASDLSKKLQGTKTFQMRMRRKLETNEVNVSRICPKSVRGIKTFQMRIKIKVKTNENQHASDLSEKHQRN